MDLTHCYKTAVFTFIFAVFFYPNPQPWYQLFRFWKQMAAMWNYTSSFDFGLILSPSACESSSYKFYLNLTIGDGIVTSRRSPKWRQRSRKSTSGFSFGDASHLRTPKSIRIPNFAKVAQSAAEILLFPVSENKRPSYWNSRLCLKKFSPLNSL